MIHCVLELLVMIQIGQVRGNYYLVEKEEQSLSDSMRESEKWGKYCCMYFCVR
jgi:hypothetical protein